jgi:hypothetical protein
MTPAIVISRPAAHQMRSVNSDLAAPTRKWAMTWQIELPPQRWRRARH